MLQKIEVIVELHPIVVSFVSAAVSVLISSWYIIYNIKDLLKLQSNSMLATNFTGNNLEQILFGCVISIGVSFPMFVDLILDCIGSWKPL